jgi:cytochrome c2
MRWAVLASATATLAAAGCAPRTSPDVPGGDPDRGAQTIANMGCGACHHIAGIPGANGMVGPPLDNVAQRGILAGEIPNTPENMVSWIRDPQSVEPTTAMPNLHLDEQSARDVVAYLYSLH